MTLAITVTFYLHFTSLFPGIPKPQTNRCGYDSSQWIMDHLFAGSEKHDHRLPGYTKLYSVAFLGAGSPETVSWSHQTGRHLESSCAICHAAFLRHTPFAAAQAVVDASSRPSVAMGTSQKEVTQCACLLWLVLLRFTSYFVALCYCDFLPRAHTTGGHCTAVFPGVFSWPRLARSN